MRITPLHPHDLEEALNLINTTCYDLSWYWGGQPEGTPVGRLCASALTSHPGSRGAPGRGRPVAMGAWSEGRRGLFGLVAFERQPDRVLFPPWNPVVSSRLSVQRRLAVGRTLVSAALEADAAGRPAPVPARSMLKFDVADRVRALQVIRTYELAGFRSRVRFTLGLTRARAAAVRPPHQQRALPAGLHWGVVPIDPADPGQMRLLSDVCVRVARAPAGDGARSRGADPDAVRRWLAEAHDAWKGGPAPGLWRVLTAYETGRGDRSGVVPLEERELVGFILVNGLGVGVFNLAGMGIVPEFRRRGLGRRLLQSTTDILWKRGAREVTAVVDGYNTPALRLFWSSGFAETARSVTLVRQPAGSGNSPAQD